MLEFKFLWIYLCLEAQFLISVVIIRIYYFLITLLLMHTF